MNKHILKIMRYQDNPELFSVEEMRENDTEAYAAEAAAYAAEAAAYAAGAYPAKAAYANAAYAAEAAAYAAVSAYAAAIAYDEANVAYDYHANTARDWVNEYFKDSDENKQDYVNEVERLK
jgi:hypothetical protein